MKLFPIKISGSAIVSYNGYTVGIQFSLTTSGHTVEIQWSFSHTVVIQYMTTIRLLYDYMTTV